MSRQTPRHRSHDPRDESRRPANIPGCPQRMRRLGGVVHRGFGGSARMGDVQRDVEIREESIRLGQLLKLADLVDNGAEVKPLLMKGMVFVNGEMEIRRGRTLCLLYTSPSPRD